MVIEFIKGIVAQFKPTFPERINTPNTMLQRLFAEFPHDAGLLTSTGRSALEEREGLDIFEEMSRDPQVVSAYSLKRNAITSGRWVVDPYSDKDQDLKIAEFVNWNLKCLLGDTALGLKDVMTAFLYGRSVSEIIWESVENGQYKGQYYISRLKSKNIGAIGFTLDDYNNVVSVNVTNNIGEQRKINPNKVVHYAWNSQFDNPYGRPDLAAVYPWWWAKKTLYKYALVYGDKYAAPIPNFKIDRKLSTDEENKLKNAASNFHISNFFMTPKGVELELLQSSGTGGDYYIQAINSLCDTQIARAILAQSLTTNENSRTGTFAQAQVHQDTMKDILEEVRNEIENNVVQEQIVKRIVDANYPGVEGYPHFRFDAFDPEWLKSAAEAFEKLAKASDDFGNHFVDVKEDWVRDRLKLPARDTKNAPLITKMPEHRKQELKPPGGGDGPPSSKPKPKPKAILNFEDLRFQNGAVL